MPVSPTGEILDQLGNPTGGKVDVATGSVITPSVTSPINSSVLSNTSNPNFQTTPTYKAQNISGIDTSIAENLSPIETDLQTRLKNLISGNEAMAGESAFKTEQGQKFGMPEQQKVYTDLTSQINQLKFQQLDLQN